MLWEILPNARGPLIVDFCLRIGYTTILLGTLGFFGLGVSPESPDWGSTIDDGRKLLSMIPHPALTPAIALMSLVLGLNLLASAGVFLVCAMAALIGGLMLRGRTKPSRMLSRSRSVFVSYALLSSLLQAWGRG